MLCVPLFWQRLSDSGCGHFVWSEGSTYCALRWQQTLSWATHRRLDMGWLYERVQYLSATVCIHGWSQRITCQLPQHFNSVMLVPCKGCLARQSFAKGNCKCFNFMILRIFSWTMYGLIPFSLLRVWGHLRTTTFARSCAAQIGVSTENGLWRFGRSTVLMVTFWSHLTHIGRAPIGVVRTLHLFCFISQMKIKICYLSSAFQASG